jgi:hypothetical protein
MPSMDIIIPVKRSEPFDDPAFLFDLKLDGYRGLADTMQGRMFSKNHNRLKRFEALLKTLPSGYVFDGWTALCRCHILGKVLSSHGVWIYQRTKAHSGRKKFT